MARHLMDRRAQFRRSSKAVALGDLPDQVKVGVQGEIHDLDMTVDSLGNQLLNRQ